jgi:anti-sigma factor RsiW
MSAPYGPDHGRWEDATGAYVLGALPPAESAAFEGHLAGCPACRAEVEELRPAVDALPASVPPLEPPRALRDRLLTDVHREAELLAAAGPEADRPPQRHRGPLRGRLPRWVSAAAAVAALGVAVVVGFAIGSGGGPQGHTIALTDAPRVAGADVRVIIRDGQAKLTADHLPPPPGNLVYQVWLKAKDGGVRPTAALFLPRSDGSAIVALPSEVADSRELMVSAEPRGGSPAPTSAPVLTGKMPS